jgi:PhzF family phenazine biosynthesis protein
MRLDYRLVNVFTVGDDPFSGNPLCVFEDGRGLDDTRMQALARQFNLSETTFLLPATDADAQVRIFTPVMELPFAGHPTLGSAHVVGSMRGGGRVTLRMAAGLIPVEREADRWTLETARGTSRPLESGRIAALLASLGLAESDLAGPPRWVATGMEQLLVPLASARSVAGAIAGPDLSAFANAMGKVGVYLFSPSRDTDIEVRFFFGRPGSALLEDPATGSACANLGTYLADTGAPLPLKRNLSQGAAIARPSSLGLAVDAAGNIRVSGGVIELGRGQVTL